MVRDPEDWFDIRSEGSLQMGLIFQLGRFHVAT